MIAPGDLHRQEFDRLLAMHRRRTWIGCLLMLLAASIVAGLVIWGVGRL